VIVPREDRALARELHSVRVAPAPPTSCSAAISGDLGLGGSSKMNDSAAGARQRDRLVRTADFVRTRLAASRNRPAADIVDAAGAKQRRIRPAGKLATALMRCDRHNMFMLGTRFRKAGCRFAEDSLLRAIEPERGCPSEFNRKSFLWGRRPQPTSRAWSASRPRPRSFPSRKRSRATSRS